MNARLLGTGAVALMAILTMGICGCGGGYSAESLYPENVSTVYVEMFDNRSFWRGQEFVLTDALAKRIEVQTPYKILADRSRADTVISGYLSDVSQITMVQESQVGRPLQQQMTLVAVVSWKDLRTGELLLDSTEVSAAADFSQFQGQGSEYASELAANRLAERIVASMRQKW